MLMPTVGILALPFKPPAISRVSRSCSCFWIAVQMLMLEVENMAMLSKPPALKAELILRSFSWITAPTSIVAIMVASSKLYATKAMVILCSCS